jgi:predicted HicB family RNase H-like nuclease
MAKQQTKQTYYDRNLLVTIDQETQDRLRAMAEQHKTSISGFVRRCLNERYEQLQRT